MKKVLVISGSARKNGSGIKAFKMFKEKFDPLHYDFEVLHLSDYNLQDCIGCTVCFKKEKCFMEDDLDTVLDKIMKVDGVIFITPIYNMNISGSLKTFFDRTTYLLHKPVFYDKHSYIISSTDMGGTKLVNLYLKYIMNAYCIDNAGSTDVISNKIKSNENYKVNLSKRFDKESSKFMASLAKGKEYEPKFSQIVRFNLWRIKALKSQDVYPGDFRYWSNDFLTNSNYFYPVKVSWIKNMLIKLIKIRLNKLMDKRI